ncbi:MAG: Uma2 family endonuclease [Armatimonadetes bacterium]|nr:Uma2 family endonuclease [Armatimonadota bacterium]
MLPEPLGAPSAGPPDDTSDEYPYYEETVTESDWHFEAQEALRFALENRYAGVPDVYVASNMFVYYEKGDRDKKVSPDTFVVLGAPRRRHKSYRIWEEGQPPAVVFEFTSESSKVTDRGTKKAIYEIMGVREYFLFDPLGEYIPGQLKGYRAQSGELLPMVGRELISEVLGIRLKPEDFLLRVYDAASGEPYLTPRESEQARREAEQARREAEQARREAEQARREAERRAEALEAELRRIRGAE